MVKAVNQFDVVVIGSGPGGYVGAIRCAQLGLKTAIVEKDKTLGGTCLNVGCIPSKALLESSELYEMSLHDFKNHGIDLSQVKLNLFQMMARKDKIVKELTQGISFLMKKNKIETFKGLGKIVQASAAAQSAIVEVTNDESVPIRIETKNIICATGSIPTALPFLKYDETKIVSSTGALALQEVPKQMIVVGGGVIGLELGSVWQRLGSQVTVIEYADKLCPTMDQQSIAVLKKSLEKSGMIFILQAKVTNSTVKGSQVEIEFEEIKTGQVKNLKADVVMVSTGRKPFSQGLGLDEIGVQKDKLGRVLVDGHFQTNIPGVYAIGDLIPGPMLAHKAEEEGVAVAEILSGQAGHVNYPTVPSVIYTHPEVASVGLTEEEATAKGYKLAVGTFPFMANGRAKALGTHEGMVKIIADKASDKILGGHIVGPRAGDLIHEIVVAMEFGGSSEDLARSFHAHPTLNEVVREAALAVDRRARQM